MNSNSFAISSSSPTVSKRYGMDGGQHKMRKMAHCSNAAKRIQQHNLKFSQRPFHYLSYRVLDLIQRAFQKEEKEDEFETVLGELAVFGSGREAIYRRQQELSVLCKKSSFTKHEVKLLYWGWKVACPDGILDERTFKEIYAQFFPQAGDSSLYAHFVFNAMFGDVITVNDGQITFLDYLVALSKLCRGTVQDKIQWIFTLYDINKDGKITYDEVLQISIAIYALLGFQVFPLHNGKTYEVQAKKVFKKLDIKQTGAVTFEQFKEVCLRDETILTSMERLDSSSI